jgi:hypothetical protein
MTGSARRTDRPLRRLGRLLLGRNELRRPCDRVEGVVVVFPAAAFLGEFEPDVWIPCSHPGAGRGVIGLAELAGLDVIHGPRRASTATYDRWLEVLRATDPRFGFTDPPVRRSLPMALAFAATASRPAAVLTGPAVIAGPPPGVIRLPRPAGAGDMARVSIAGHPLTATAALVWDGDLPRPLQQILFDTADGLTRPAPASLSPAG